MKKIIAILLVVLLAFAFVSCGIGECDFCGETASLKKFTYQVESSKLCEDCYDYYDFEKSMTEFSTYFGY